MYMTPGSGIYIYIYIYIEREREREIENKDDSQEILDTTKIIKTQRQPKNPKRILTFCTFGKQQHKELPNAKINDAKFVIWL